MAWCRSFLGHLSLAEPLATTQLLAALHRRLVIRYDGSDALLEERRQTQSHAVDLGSEREGEEMDSVEIRNISIL